MNQGPPADAAVPASSPAIAAAARPRHASAAAELQSLAELSAEVRAVATERWRTYYAARGTLSEPRVTVTPKQFGFSVIFKVDLDFPNGLGSECFMVKIRRQQRSGSFLREEMSERTLALSRAEYDQHVAAHSFFAGRSDGLSVVRPLDFIESRNAFVVEHAAGDDLSELVKRNSQLAEASVRRCGEWWRLFHHDLHGAGERPWDASVIDAMLEHRLTKLRAVGAPAARLDQLSRDIRRVARSVPPVAVPVSVVHGDCKLRHVWASTGGIQVLDFGNTKTGDSWMDPAALVVELSLFSLWTRRLDSAPKVPEMRALLHAYFNGAPPPAFALYVIDALLKKWHRRLRNWWPRADLKQVRRSLQAARLDKAVERLYIDRWFMTQIRAWLGVAEGQPPQWLQPVVE